MTIAADFLNPSNPPSFLPISSKTPMYPVIVSETPFAQSDDGNDPQTDPALVKALPDDIKPVVMYIIPFNIFWTTSSPFVNQPVSSLSDLNTGANAFNAAPTPSPHSFFGTLSSENTAGFAANLPAAAIIPSDIVKIAFFIASIETPLPKRPFSFANIEYTGAKAPIAKPTPSDHSFLGPPSNAVVPENLTAAVNIPSDIVTIAFEKSVELTPDPPNSSITLPAINIE